jgi:acetyl esterase/lipase
MRGQPEDIDFMRNRSILTAALLASALSAPAALAQTAQENNAKPTVVDKVQSAVSSLTGSPLAAADTDMKHVLDALDALDGKAIEGDFAATEARQQPTASDAAMQVLREQGKSTLPDMSIKTKNVLVDGGAGTIPATVYMPADASGPLPVIVYYHGGGFVIANNAVYDASARGLSKSTNAIVVAVEYSKAPEHKFPAAHEDAVAAYKWVLKNAGGMGGDAAKIAVAGESAGGNLAVNVAIAARDQNLPAPVHLLLVYPMAGTNLDTQSYKDNAAAVPLNKPMMEWFYKNATSKPEDMQDPRLDIVGKADLKGLPSTTLITAQIDPLLLDGQALANKLKQAGVTVNDKTFDGVTHEFFGMGLVVADAKAAEEMAVTDFKAAFAKPAAK